jgi:ABC-type transport system substrate-binding protein
LLATIFIVATTLMAPWPALAQDATPTAGGEPTRSLTREEFTAELVEAQGYTEAETPGGTFVDASIADIQTVQPFLAEEVTTGAVVGLMYEALIGGDPRTGQIAPTGLADYWELAPDNRTYTFHLNKDAKWHDGVDLTAEATKLPV